jgi:hypothetical protein
VLAVYNYIRTCAMRDAVYTFLLFFVTGISTVPHKAIALQMIQVEKRAFPQLYSDDATTRAGRFVLQVLAEAGTAVGAAARRQEHARRG